MVGVLQLNWVHLASRIPSALSQPKVSLRILIMASECG